VRGAPEEGNRPGTVRYTTRGDRTICWATGTRIGAEPEPARKTRATIRIRSGRCVSHVEPVRSPRPAAAHALTAFHWVRGAGLAAAPGAPARHWSCRVSRGRPPAVPWHGAAGLPRLGDRAVGRRTPKPADGPHPSTAFPSPPPPECHGLVVRVSHPPSSRPPRSGWPGARRRCGRNPATTAAGEVGTSVDELLATLGRGCEAFEEQRPGNAGQSLVGLCRRRGAAWSEIATALGVSRQAVHELSLARLAVEHRVACHSRAAAR